MSEPIQAQSISSLNTLLANPPRYPRNPTHEVHDPLILYIVRVPGSKDVFLTPLKPPTKASISIDAVQSSLYYLHVERPEDDALRNSLEAFQIAERRNKDLSPIQRKPLPSTPYANYPASQRPPTPPKSYPHYQPALEPAENPTQLERYVARGVHLRLSTTNEANASATGPARKPVGARPMPTRPDADVSPGSNDQDGESSPDPIEFAKAQFKLARKPIKSVPTEDHHGSPTNEARDVVPPLQDVNVPPQADNTENLTSGTLRITLIRRDPASGSQWNVATIIQQSGATPLRKVDLELNSPGYRKFAQLEGAPGQGLKRHVSYMPGSNVEGAPVPGRRSSTIDSFSSSTGKKARQVYAFMSPWQGMCSFSNGLDGKSLRCRHFLPAANQSMPGVAADVAELRFNLPWATLRLRDPNKQAGTELSDWPASAGPPRSANPSNKENWRRSIQALTHKARMPLSNGDRGASVPSITASRRDSTDQDNPIDLGRMRLDLGREKAGGGFKGHSAKLGKLIIDDEGLKMCDLVVAACMGVWWQHYAADMAS